MGVAENHGANRLGNLVALRGTRSEGVGGITHCVPDGAHVFGQVSRTLALRGRPHQSDGRSNRVDDLAEVMRILCREDGEQKL